MSFAGQNFSCPTFVKFSQSAGVSVGIRPLMLAIAHVKQPFQGQNQFCPANDIIFFQAINKDAILIETRLDINRKEIIEFCVIKCLANRATS